MGSASGIANEKPERMIRPWPAVAAAIQIELLTACASAFSDDRIVATLRGAIDPGFY